MKYIVTMFILIANSFMILFKEGLFVASTDIFDGETCIILNIEKKVRHLRQLHHNRYGLSLQKLKLTSILNN